MTTIVLLNDVNEAHLQAVKTEMAEEIRGLVAGRGSAARYGGEEFVAYLPNAPLQEAIALGELVAFPLPAGIGIMRR